MVDRVSVIVDWPLAVQTGDPTGYIQGLVAEKLQLQYGFSPDEIEAVKSDALCKQSAQEQAGRLHKAEEIRKTKEWHAPDQTEEKVEEKVWIKYNRPGTRGWMNRRRGDVLRGE